jgi:hypothetical protein
MVSAALRARSALRRTRDRWIDQTLVSVERARAALEAGQVDVLILGDSSSLSWAWSDTDRTLIPQMIAERTGARVVTVAKGGYSAPVYDAVLRVLAELPQRPKALLTTACIRTAAFDHVRRHPIHGHARSIEALAKVKGDGGRIRAFARGGSTWTDRELAAFRALPMTTRWGGEQLIGDHLDRIEGMGPPPWPPEIERARYDYFNGEVLAEDCPELEHLDRYGRRLVDYGVPMAAYWVTPALAHGERLLPGFTDHVRSNVAVLEKAWDLPGRGLGELIKLDLEDEDFQDVRNGIEHYTFSGRSKLADALIESIAPALG